MVNHTVLTERFIEPRDVRLGRHVEHDSRSWDFRVRTSKAKPKTVLWGHEAPVLDQGQLGSCTGNATAQLINTDAFAPIRNKVKGNYLVESDAVAIYSAATELDNIAGQYPPTDTGSSGLAVAKAGENMGYFSGYKHSFSFSTLLTALQSQPVICGTVWTNGMFKPNKKGFISPTGTVAGGHEYLCLGCNVSGQYLTFLNSWSDTWGIGGRFYVTFSDYQNILSQQGDVTVPISAV